jgi:CubicO group peptidase (beta-lactamase class C family)
MTKRAATAVVVAALLALTGCKPAQPVSGPPELSDAPPIEVSGLAIPPGRIDDAVTKVDGLVGDLMKSTGIPGMTRAIVHGGKTLYAKGFGVRGASKGDAQDSDKLGTFTR